MVVAIGSLLVVGLLGILLLGGDAEPREFSAAPQRCVDQWNGDRYASSTLGRHQFTIHGYARVQILTLSADGRTQLAPNQHEATCAIVFASASLDTETSAAAVIVRKFGWGALADLQPVDRLAQLQSDAQTGYNATLQEDGKVQPL